MSVRPLEIADPQQVLDQLRGRIAALQGGPSRLTVLGAAIALVTLAMVVNSVTGEPVPYVPPLGWVTVVGGTALLALFTTVLPIGRLLRVPPIEHMGVKE